MWHDQRGNPKNKARGRYTRNSSILRFHGQIPGAALGTPSASSAFAISGENSCQELGRSRTLMSSASLIGQGKKHTTRPMQIPLFVSWFRETWFLEAQPPGPGAGTWIHKFCQFSVEMAPTGRRKMIFALRKWCKGRSGAIKVDIFLSFHSFAER